MNPIDNPNEDTEFNDILRQHGILPPREKAPRTPSPPPLATLTEKLEDKSSADIAALEEEANDSDEERLIAAYRRQRLAEIKKQEKVSRFGDVMPIGRDDYSREVTQASKEDERDAEVKDLGTGVIACLYKDGESQSMQLLAQLRTLATRYPRSKFVSIVGNKCIENYPDRLQPTLILYRAGEVVAQVVSWGKDRVRDPNELEALLVVSKVVFVADRVQADDLPARVGGKGDLDDEVSDEEPTHKVNATRKATVPQRGSRIRGRTTVEDDDSDFDL